jgi:DNA-binding IclR family transcriptional regulator
LQGRSIVVDVAYPRGAIADAGIVVGLIHSVFHSACGKVCAAFAAADDRERLLREDAGAAGGATVRSRWNEEFARIRATRLAVRSEDEVLALAAPLFRAEGRFCGALGVFLPPGARLTPAIERSVRRTAEALSFALGYPYSQ